MWSTTYKGPIPPIDIYSSIQFAFQFLTSNSSSIMPRIATTSIHGGNEAHRVSDVIPPINITTTFRYDSDPEKLHPVQVDENGNEVELADEIVYSRLAHPNGVIIEKIVGKLTNSHAVVYSSGLGAFHAAMTHFNPKKLAIGKSYHGCHGIANILSRNYGLEQVSLADEDLDKLGKGDVIHIETPVNPESWCYDIQYFADKAHSKGAFLLVDSTFAPLQDPFAFGADMVMHSATKYFGGHSDLLSGLLLTKNEDIKTQLFHDRIYLGTNIGNLEAALLIRSLKTFELRVRQQSKSATQLVAYLNENRAKFPKLTKIHHSSLQKDAFVEKQVRGVHSPTFSIEVESEDFAKRLPSRLKYFFHATSLGGAESLIEWRCMTDASASRTLLRVSIGLEDIDDLIEDFEQALTL